MLKQAHKTSFAISPEQIGFQISMMPSFKGLADDCLQKLTGSSESSSFLLIL